MTLLFTNWLLQMIFKSIKIWWKIRNNLMLFELHSWQQIWSQSFMIYILIRSIPILFLINNALRNCIFTMETGATDSSTENTQFIFVQISFLFCHLWMLRGRYNCIELSIYTLWLTLIYHNGVKLYGLFSCIIILANDFFIDNLSSKITLKMLKEFLLNDSNDDEPPSEPNVIKMSGSENEVSSMGSSDSNREDPIICNSKMLTLLNNKNGITAEQIKYLNKLNGYDSLSFSRKRKNSVNLKRKTKATKFFRKHLNLNKLDSWALDYNFWFFDIRRWIKETISNFTVNTNFDENKLNFNISNEIPLFIYSDESRLQQIIKNLLWVIDNCWNDQIIHLNISEADSKKIYNDGITKDKNHIVFEIYSNINSDYSKKIVDVINYNTQDINEMDNTIFGLFIADLWVRGLQSKLHLQIEESCLKLSFHLKLDSNDDYTTWAGSTLERTMKFLTFENSDKTVIDEKSKKQLPEKKASINLPYNTQVTRWMFPELSNTRKVPNRTF